MRTLAQSQKNKEKTCTHIHIYVQVFSLHRKDSAPITDFMKSKSCVLLRSRNSSVHDMSRVYPLGGGMDVHKRVLKKEKVATNLTEVLTVIEFFDIL